MEQDEIWRHAQGLLRDLADVTLDRFTLGEMLFLSRHCPRQSGEEINVIAAFDEHDLRELMEIVVAVSARGGKQMIH